MRGQASDHVQRDAAVCGGGGFTGPTLQAVSKSGGFGYDSQCCDSRRRSRGSAWSQQAASLELTPTSNKRQRRLEQCNGNGKGANSRLHRAEQNNYAPTLQKNVCLARIRSVRRISNPWLDQLTHDDSPVRIPTDRSILRYAPDEMPQGLISSEQTNQKGIARGRHVQESQLKPANLPLTVAGTASLFENDRNPRIPYGFMPGHIMGTACFMFPISCSKRAFLFCLLPSKKFGVKTVSLSPNTTCTPQNPFYDRVYRR